MKLARVDMGAFFTYKSFAFDLPEEGVLVLVGENGSGKTAAGVEAMAWALWGETVRGDDPVPEGAVNIGAEVGGREWRVERTRLGRKTVDLVLTELLYDGDDEADRSGQTPTETQGKIDTLFGTWERFCATRVFSRALLSRFSDSTNKDRQQLLENILGLEQFERALKVTRGVKTTRQNDASAKSGALNTAMAALTRSREAAGGAQAAPVDVRGLEAQIAQLAADGEAVVAKAREVAAKISRAEPGYRRGTEALSARTQAARSLEQRVTALQSRAAGAGRLTDCPVCLRAVADGDRDAIRRHYAEEAAPLEAEAAKLRAEAEVLAADNEEQDAALRALRATLQQLEDQALAADRAHLDAQRDLAVARSRAVEQGRHQAMVARDEGLVEEAATAKLEADRLLAVAESAVEVLGPRGAKVALFRSELGRLQDGANQVLEKLGMAIRVRLSDKRTQATGREVDEVTLEVENAHGASRYSGCSDGERRRVDVALLLALSGMARETGLLLFDEVFDSLDDDGLERVSELLADMGKTRQLVITTHSQELAALVPGAKVWNVRKVDGASTIDVGG